MPPAWLFEVEKPASAAAEVSATFAAFHGARDLASVVSLIADAIVQVVVAFETLFVTAIVFEFGLGHLVTDWTLSAAATAVVTVDLDLATNLTCSAEIAAV